MLFVTHSLPGQALGMLFRVMGASALAITLNLYIMDHIRKTEFMQSESLRMAWSMIAWTSGPTLGVFLYTRFGILAPHLLVIAFAATLLCLFWYFRLSDNALIRPGRTPASNPLKNIGRFVAQPRLRLAWLIAFGRSCFWTTFFVYGPLLMVVTGEGSLVGGLLVSAGNAHAVHGDLLGQGRQEDSARATRWRCRSAAIAAALAGCRPLRRGAAADRGRASCSARPSLPCRSTRWARRLSCARCARMSGRR